jgi:hypothetical protein
MTLNKLHQEKQLKIKARKKLKEFNLSQLLLKSK